MGYQQQMKDQRGSLMRNSRQIDRTNLASFSGIDGAGKSTQIEVLRARLETVGRKVVVVRFWDDIARLTRLREGAGHTIFKGDKGVGTPSTPIERRDKNVSSWAMTGVRLFIYFIDAVSVRGAVKRALNSGADLVIFDRYIYDELANLTLRNSAMRAYARLIMTIVPRPDISYVLDADPLKARARKPEYPLEFLCTNRQSYQTLCDLIGGMTVIAAMPVEDVKLAVFRHALEHFSFSNRPHSRTAGIALGDPGGEVATIDSPQASQAPS
jgi:thymidylate kinase